MNEWIAEHPARLSVWSEGFLAGWDVAMTLAAYDRTGAVAYADGIAVGRAQVEAEDAARWAGYREENRRRGNVPTADELAWRRGAFRAQALSAADIRERAAESWGLDRARVMSA